MVLWEITLATAYFLGLKRTYRLALKLQRRVVSHKHPKIRGFLQRRTRAAFDVALSVHRKVQQRDLEVGRNLGNWMLRWLDRMKPSAEIRASPPKPPSCTNVPRCTTNAGQSPGTHNQNIKTRDHDSSRHLFSAWTFRPKSFLTETMVMRPPRIGGMTNQYRHASNFTSFAPEMNRNRGLQGVFRNDIYQWMQHV